MPQKIKTVAQFQVDYFQVLNEHVALVAPLPTFATNHTKLVSLYEMMVLTRIFDAKAIALQRTGRLGTYPSSYGQEAISVAIGSAMHEDDVFCPYYREYGTHLQRGVTMEEIFLFWGGDERGSCYKNCKEDMPHCIPIASQCLHGVGIAAAMKYREQQRCAVICIGEGGTSEGDFYEALNVAGAWNLPAVFVINNNQWAISVPRHEQTSTETIAQKAFAGGLRCLQVDGNDVIAMHEAMDEAIALARQGKGGTVIEAITYRLCDHTTADDARRYRNPEEVSDAEFREPVRRLREYLIQQNVWSEEKEQALISRCQQQVEDAVARYEATPPQPIESVFDHLYATLPDIYFEQREELMANADTVGGEHG